MTLPWKRFWVPLGSSISCGFGGDGFFDDPEEISGFLNKKIARHLDVLLAEPCLVLLGEPGLGKSVALEQAFPGVNHTAGGNATTIWIRFRDIPDSSTLHRRIFQDSRWHSWLKAPHELTIVLDGLDEGLIKINDLVCYLTSDLRSAPLNRLRLIVASRTADWPVSAGQQLLSLWNNNPSQGIWELCPLRRVDAELAAKSNDLALDHFFQQIYDKKVVTFAARPTTLFFLVQQFRSNGTLEGSHRDIYDRGIIDLCREPDRGRAESNRFYDTSGQVSSPTTIRDGAATLAALLIFGGRSAISTEPNENVALREDLHLPSTFDKFERLGNRHAVISSLSTALFSSRAENRFGFSHQTFAECLAAHRARELPLVQLRKLFCGIDGRDEHVIPQLAETAAWLAGINDDFLAHLLAIDPEVLLSSDVARIQGNRKEQIVSAILEKAKRHELFDHFALLRFLSGLKHPQLAQQLWQYIKDGSLNIVVRRLALAIAQECRLAELNDDLLPMLTHPDLEQQVKEAAARVLVGTLPDERLVELECLAQGQCGPDPDDQLKGVGLSGLVPKHWSISQALAYITVPKRTRLRGAYDKFLSYTAPNSIVVNDLPDLLAWLTNVEHCFDILNPFHALAYRGICLALSNLEIALVRDAAVQLWRKHRDSFRDDESETFWSNVTGRRKLAFHILQNSETTDDDVAHLMFSSFAVLRDADLRWMLEQLQIVQTDRRPAWTYAISLLVGPNTRPEIILECWDLFIQRFGEIPELRSRFSWFRHWDIGEPLAQEVKAEYLRIERDRHRFEEQQESPDLEALISRYLDLISQGEIVHWINLYHCLSLKKGERYFRQIYDITATPGWESADDSRRLLIRNAARQFVLHCTDGYKTHGDQTKFSDPGYIAIWLLRDEIVPDEDLRRAVADGWINAIVGFLNNGEDHYQEMVALAHQINADETINAVQRKAQKYFEQGGYTLVWRGLSRCWDDRVSQILIEFVDSHLAKKETVISSLCALFEHDPTAFENWMRLTLSEIQTQTEEARVTIVAIALALAPADTWDLIWELLVRDTEFAKRVCLVVASDITLDVQERRPKLEANKLRELAELLYTLFPPDPEVEDKNAWVTQRHAVVDLRRQVADTLTGSSDPNAGDALVYLAKRFPKCQIEFLARYQDHLKTRRRRLWEPLPTQDLIDLLARPEARLVLNDYDLFEVVIESLSRFELYHTRQERPAVRRLWNQTSRGNHRIEITPKEEEELSDELARWLDGDLGPKAGIIIGREVQIERRQRTDVLVKAVIPGREENANESATVVIEVKGCWNPEVRTGLENQLVQKYLLLHNWTFGIYVVGWYMCDAWKNSRNSLESATLEDAREELRRLADEASRQHSELKVFSVALDCRYR